MNATGWNLLRQFFLSSGREWLPRLIDAIESMPDDEHRNRRECGGAGPEGKPGRRYRHHRGTVEGSARSGSDPIKTLNLTTAHCQLLTELLSDFRRIHNR